MATSVNNAQQRLSYSKSVALPVCVHPLTRWPFRHDWHAHLVPSGRTTMPGRLRKRAGRLLADWEALGGGWLELTLRDFAERVPIQGS